MSVVSEREIAYKFYKTASIKDIKQKKSFWGCLQIKLEKHIAKL